MTSPGTDEGSAASRRSAARLHALLRGVPLFSCLDDEALERMVAAGRVVDVPADHIIFAEGAAGEAMYVILRGRVRILKRMGPLDRVLAVKRKKDFLGEMAIIDGEPRSASAVAATPAKLFRLRRQEFHEVVLTSREAVLSLLAGVTERTRRAHETEAALIAELQRKNRALERFSGRLEERVRKQTRELRRINHELRTLAMRDGLTGIYNRRVFGQMLEGVLSGQRERARRASLVMLDVDHFKQLNDRHGHQGGDRVLVELTRVLGGLLGAGQIVARYGGEEFAVISPGGRQRAAATAEAIRSAIERHVFPLRDAAPGSVTISLGVACCPDDGATPADLVAAADAALYRAKAEGRNRVVVHASNGGGHHG